MVDGNPIENPPMEVIEQGNQAILDYFRDLETQGTEKLNEAKLIIVGEPGAGKTSLMETLLNPEFKLCPDTETTLGITVSEGWEFPHPQKPDTPFTTNIWDFGGQQIQYMTHQFFLTPGAAYVLVSANDRKEPTNFPANPADPY
jgi:GTPase SAR1 family protein